jgi:tRNA(Ile)-lysidine synthase
MPRPLVLDAAARHLGELVGRACLQPGAAGSDTGVDTARCGVVVALSGGPDSVALLLVARHWARGADAPLVAAHLNHGLRPGAADLDAAFCRDLCQRLGLDLVESDADPRAAARERGLGLEEAARHLRRRFLQEVLAERPWPGCVATGHHRDDQVETVLMRLLRGTGPEGLRGIRPVAGEFIHPLLGFDRATIVAFLEERGQPWRLDATNLEGDNLRARLRREVVPVLRDVFGDGCLEGPARLAELLEADLDLLDVWAGQALSEAVDGLSLRVDALLALPPALAGRVLRRWLDTPDQLEAVHVAAILGWLREGTSGGGLDLPGGRRLTREFNRLLPGIGPAPDGGPEDWRPEVRRLPEGSLPGVAGAVGLDNGGPGNGCRDNGFLDNPGAWSLICPASALRGNLRVRGWRRGDRLRPLGLGGSKKVSDLLREARVPASRRGGVLIVDDDEGILWIVGVARDERTRLLPDSGGTVTISVIRRTYPTTQGTRSS